MSNISISSRRVIRTLTKLVKHYGIIHDCEKDCKCEVCKAVRSAKKEEKKLTAIINANKRCRELVGLRGKK